MSVLKLSFRQKFFERIQTKMLKRIHISLHTLNSIQSNRKYFTNIIYNELDRTTKQYT